MRDEVHAVGYRRLDEPRPVWPGWPIARTLLVLAWRRRATKLGLLVCFGVFGVHGVWVVGQLVAKRYFESKANSALLGTDKLVGQVHEALASYVSVQFFTTALVLAVVAAGAIAEDRRVGAFELYFARPLSRMQYALGKLLGAGIVPLATLVGPAFILWLAAAGIAPPSLRGELWWLAVPALASATLGAAVLTATSVGLSALGQRARTVGAVYVAGLVILAGVTEGLAESGYPSFGYLSPERDLRTVVDWLLQVGNQSVAAKIIPGRPPTNSDPIGSLLGLLAWTGAGLGALAWRIQREVRRG
ncbi:MAG: ABC transporter permease subunit [Myxococcales bacterium]|nr:ABC transporter permease subunit [Myxococcales bacterium]